jgi:hypothetical protein
MAVDNLWLLGFAATCNAHGASEPGKAPKWTKKHSEQLRGADIVVLNDNDAPGYEHAEVTYQLSLGVAKRVRRLDLKDSWPAIKEHGDVSDWIAAGHVRSELEALISLGRPRRRGRAERSSSARPSSGIPSRPTSARRRCASAC